MLRVSHRLVVSDLFSTGRLHMTWTNFMLGLAVAFFIFLFIFFPGDGGDSGDWGGDDGFGD